MPTPHPLHPQSLSPTELDAQYNNRALVPEFAEHIERWQRESALVRASQAHMIGLPYAQGKGATLDIFPCTDIRKKPAPVLLFIHGGYWRSLDKADHSFIARAFTAQACVVVPNYALCPGTAKQPVTIAHIAKQMVAALAYVQAHIGQHGGDAARIVVAGHSAGGHLAAMLAAANPGLQAVAVSGLFELESIQHTPFLQSSLQLDAATATACSPAWMPAPAGGQLACFVGAQESAEFRRQNTLMRKAWGKARVPVVAEIAGANHFTVLDALVDGKSALHRHVLKALG